MLRRHSYLFPYARLALFKHAELEAKAEKEGGTPNYDEFAKSVLAYFAASDWFLLRFIRGVMK